MKYFLVPFRPAGGGKVDLGRIGADNASEAACLFVRAHPDVIVWGYPVVVADWKHAGAVVDAANAAVAA